MAAPTTVWIAVIWWLRCASTVCDPGVSVLAFSTSEACQSWLAYTAKNASAETPGIDRKSSFCVQRNIWPATNDEPSIEIRPR